LVSEQADRSSAQVSFHVSPCDGYSGVILVEDVTDPATVPVVVQRPFGPLCGDQNPLVEKMRAANVGTTLPPHLEHAPTGPYVQ
jgi:hypothetical protein